MVRLSTKNYLKVGFVSFVVPAKIGRLLWVHIIYYLFLFVADRPKKSKSAFIFAFIAKKFLFVVTLCGLYMGFVDFYVLAKIYGILSSKCPVVKSAKLEEN